MLRPKQPQQKLKLAHRRLAMHRRLLKQVPSRPLCKQKKCANGLKDQLNQVLQTKETARGLIVNMSDVLFDFNKYTLKTDAREKLAKVSGILLAYPNLKLQIEGYTDNIGSDEYNQKLSEQRADGVRDYLVSQSVQDNNITAAGFGKSSPIADNSTNSGRAQNRRVQLVVSGDAIGVHQESSPERSKSNNIALMSYTTLLGCPNAGQPIF